MNPTHVLASVWIENEDQLQGEQFAASMSSLNREDGEASGEEGEDSRAEEEEEGPDYHTRPPSAAASGRKESQRSRRVVSIESHLSNLEITPKLRQLLLLKSFSARLSLAILRWKVAHLHPAFVQDMVGLLPFEKEDETNSDNISNSNTSFNVLRIN